MLANRILGLSAMVFFNYSTMQMAAKIVYYGPGLCGKTTNLQYIYNHTAQGSRGEMVSLETETDRTLFFDLLPIDVGSIAGFHTRIQLYTVPGQVFYNTTRKLVLKGVDGVVFVADSQRPMLGANIDSLNNLEENLAEMGLAIDSIPLVLQFNKRDLPDISSVAELNEALNRYQWQAVEASAINGGGVFETLKGVSKQTLVALKKRLERGGEASLAARQRRSVSVPGEVGGEIVAPTPKPAPAPAAAPAAVPPPPAVPASPAADKGTKAQEAPKPVAGAKGRKGKPERGATRQLDVLAELERIRKQALRVPSPSLPVSVARNGRREVSRDIKMSLDRDVLMRTRRFSLSFRLEDGSHQVVETVRDVELDIEPTESTTNVTVRLNIALDVNDS